MLSTSYKEREIFANMLENIDNYIVKCISLKLSLEINGGLKIEISVRDYISKTINYISK